MQHLRSHAFGNGDLAQFLAAMESASGRSLEAWSTAWLRTSGADRLAVDDGVLTRTPPAGHPADRPHTLDVAAFAGGRELARVDVVAQGERTPVPGLGSLPEGAIVVPNAGDLTWAEVSLDPSTLAALPAGLAGVPDAQARAVLWVALLGAVYRAEVDPRVALEVFAAAWPHETSAAVLSRAALAMTNRVVPMFLPPAEQDDALAGVAAAADVLADRAATVDGAAGDGLAVVAARVWVGSGCDVDRLRRWAEGSGIPAVLDGDDDFRWSVLRRLASLDALSENEIDAAAAADRSLAGSLAALGVRAVRPTAAAKAWAWAALRDDAELSNYAALSVAGGFWVAPDPELVRPYVEQVGDLCVALSARMGDDAVSRVANAIHPTRLVDDATAAASAALLERDDLTPGVRRALLDADHELREALASRRRFDPVLDDGSRP